MNKNIMYLVIAVAVISIAGVSYFVYDHFKPTVQDNTQITNAAGKVDISINAFKFNPNTLKIKKGTTVVWTNDDSIVHTVTMDTGSQDGPSSQRLNKGDTYQYTFNKVGTYTYHCDIHSTMHGTIEVV